MEDGWESHVSPLMMGVGMDMGEMQQQHPGEMDMHQEMGSHQGMGRLHHQELEQEMEMRGGHHHDGLGGEYYSHQVIAIFNNT